MSSFRTVLVRDSTLGDLTDDIDYAVQSGASQCTFQQFPTTSASNSAVIWNVQVPSENVIIGRDVLINTGLTFRLNLGSATDATKQVAVGDTAMEIGSTDSLHAFPLNSLFTTATAQINNTTVSCNVQDVLPSLLRMNNSRELYAANSTTASFPDQAYGEYADAVGALNNPMAAYNTASYDLDQVPRGAFPLTYTVVHNITGAGQDNSLVSTNVADTWVVTVSTIITEPLFLSPFIFGDGEFNKQGFLGINNMSFTFNIDSEAKRLWSTANNYVTSIALGSAANPNGFNYQPQATGGAILQTPPANPQMLFKFLSSQPSDLIASKNIVPYMDFPRYLTSSANAAALASGATSLLTSSNIQINQIPDLFIINIRKPMAIQDSSDADAFFKINNISINLNNQSGLLSSSTPYDLWKMSVRNGSTQTWSEFSGQSQVTSATGVVTKAVTTGSLLIINPAYDLSLPDYISSGSLGNYNFQFNVGVTNQFSDVITPEICTITVNSGIMSTQQGVSSIYTGILTKEMVLDAKSKQQASAVRSAEIKRMVGGSLFNMPLTAIASKIGKYLPLARQLTGLGTSGGGTSGGGTSGGAKKYC
jgi:hypothetical protein